MATTVNAQIIRMQDSLGTIEKGKFADIIAVSGDPLQDITEIQRIKFVMKGGVVVRTIWRQVRCCPRRLGLYNKDDNWRQVDWKNGSASFTVRSLYVCGTDGHSSAIRWRQHNGIARGDSGSQCQESKFQ